MRMTDSQLTAEVLLNLGFVDVGKWQPKGDSIAYDLDGADASASEVLLDAPNALYAFVRDDQVVYIGKTARSIRKRFVGYCRPGKTQATNQRCHRNIKAAIAEGTEIRIFVFTPITHLRYSDFEINLAAGLEDSLIREFDPSWNGKDRGHPISEDAEREEEEESEFGASDVVAIADAPAEPRASPQAMATFSVFLGATYYEKGILNLGVEASEYLGKDGDPIRVRFNDGSQTVVSKINRTANRTGAVRVIGGNAQIARWFQENFSEGDTVHGSVVDPHTIQLLAR
ncbi:GIY-YIG nuclease family protein [Sinorhizobium meliloti]|nr:GIY-YIG nuclease family protein [Sinorhizobium meliloti]MDW9643490.1 GIY-YIG nuclease family protein [Sinorhizobium meliloti]MDW9925087.1 GIY-YIG nuclease family protein [Sinorhizobium meliloti]MDX0028549.1 GIY-YIG nuclease family protein [Sinorhizobium meliloti]MDX0036272.1 GIY-YIG nuclease family protein [Sinorhizobium meliloti]